MTTSTQSTAPARNRSRLWSAAKIVVFDIAGPLVAYQMLRSAGLSNVSALVLSGVLPGIAVPDQAAQHRDAGQHTAQDQGRYVAQPGRA